MIQEKQSDEVQPSLIHLIYIKFRARLKHRASLGHVYADENEGG